MAAQFFTRTTFKIKRAESEKVARFCLQLQNIPPDLSQCVFVIEQALSVRALQELVTAAGSETVTYHFFITRKHCTTIYYIYIYIYIMENIVTTFTKQFFVDDEKCI